MSTEKVTVMADINAENDRVSARIEAELAQSGVMAVNVMGAPGVGKTSCLARVIQGLAPVRSYVIEGDIQSDIDTDKLTALGIEAVQIHTGGACHIDGTLIEQTLPRFNLREPGILWIENIGNLVCPAEFNIGERFKVLIVTVAEGADKPYKYPLAFEKAAAILLNKTDLLPYVDFDMEYFLAGVRALNAGAPVFEVSAKSGVGFDQVCSWMRSKWLEAR